VIDVPIVLAGHGPVGREYVDLVRTHRHEWSRRYGVRLRVAVVRGRHAQAWVGSEGVVPTRDQWTDLGDLAEVVSRAGARVFAQAVPSDGDRRAADEALVALRHDAHLVTATKSHLLVHWAALRDAALASRRAVRISGATGAAMPAGDLARSALRGFDVDQVSGCFNGTATFVLDRLAEGHALEDAVAEAQRRGIAEADPTADLSGADAAAKLRLITGLLWEWDVSTQGVRTEAVDASTAQRAREAAERGARLRHVASARAGEPGRGVVVLREEPLSGAFGALIGPEKAVRYECGAAGDLVVSGGRSSPRGAALAMIKDTLGCVLESMPGFG
jgi:homoserine dehydrogenase